MKAIIQVVKDASISVGGKLVSSIGKGLVVYFGVEKGDKIEQLDFFAKKIATLRIFADSNGKTNLSIKDVGGEVLLISQFTLAGDFVHGNRPSFSNAENYEVAKDMYDTLCGKVEKEYGIVVKKGVFGEDMEVKQTGDGPFTAIL